MIGEFRVAYVKDAWWNNVCMCGVRGHVVLYIVCALLYNECSDEEQQLYA